MSLPTQKDLLYDPLRGRIIGVIRFLHAMPDIETIQASVGSELKYKLFGLQVFGSELDQQIALKQEQLLPTAEIKRGIAALDCLLLGNRVFNGNVDVDFRFTPKASYRNLGWSYVCTEEAAIGKSGESKRPKIRVHPFAHKDSKSMIATIVHEMAHIFVGVAYKAEGLDKSSNEQVLEVFHKFEGATGHGWYWQVLAAHLENGTEKILGRALDLGRWAGVLVEALETGVPGLSYFQDLHAVRPFPGFSTPEAARAHIQVQYQKIMEDKEKKRQANEEDGGTSGHDDEEQGDNPGDNHFDLSRRTIDDMLPEDEGEENEADKRPLTIDPRKVFAKLAPSVDDSDWSWFP